MDKYLKGHKQQNRASVKTWLDSEHGFGMFIYLGSYPNKQG